MTELDPLLLGWVREFVQSSQYASARDVEREFFPDEPRAALRYFNRATGKRLKRGEIDWSQYADGELHSLTEDEIRERHGHTIQVFRHRLTKHCRRRGVMYSASRKAGVLYFRVQG